MIHVVDQDEDRLDFEIARATRIERLYEAAKKALDLASLFACESMRASVPVSADHRVIGCVRQVGEYRRAIARLRALRFSDIDTILMVALQEDAA